MNRNRSRAFGVLVVAGGAVLAACSVDTSGVRFVADEVLAEGGDFGDGGGGRPSLGGALNKAGSTGKAGSNKGGSTPTGGTNPGVGNNPGVGGNAGTGGSGVVPPRGGMGGMGTPGVCPLAKGNPREPEIDNFDDQDSGISMRGGRAGGWYITTDGTGLQVPAEDPSRPPIPDKPDLSGVGYAMHISGTGYTEWGANLGATLLSVPGRTPCPYDVSPHTGIRFYVKGKVVPGYVMRFSLITTEVSDVARGGTCDPTAETCFDTFGVEFTVTAEWKPVSIPFANLRQGGFGTKKDLNLEHVMNIEFGVKADVSFDYWLDEVEFY